MKIALPSRGRVNFPATSFLQSVAQDVYVFVDPPDTLAYSQAKLSFNIVDVHEVKGLYYVMNYILNFMQYTCDKVMIIDDDVQGIYVRQGLTKGGYPKLVKLNDLQPMFCDVEKIMNDFDLAILHLHQNHYNWMNLELELGKVGGYHVTFVDNKKIAKIRYDESLKLRSDTDFYIQMCKAGLRMATYYKYAYVSDSLKVDKQGGCLADKDTIEKTKDYSQAVVDKWKNPYIRIKQDKHTGRWGVIVNWRKLYPEPFWERYGEYACSNTKQSKTKISFI